MIRTMGFLAARSKLEAVTRISAVADAPPETLGPGSKERKSVLVNLANNLALEVDVAADKPELGRQISLKFDMFWTPECWSTGHTITLEGLNRILRGAEEYRARHPARTQFHPARSKFEAVTRISSLTDGPPQTLGPGSKERKSVLINLASALALDVDARQSKPDLAESIVTQLAGSWDETCWSAGQTITLEGLNRILGSAERQLARRGVRVTSSTFSSPRKEAEALLSVLATAIPEQMDGKQCVTEMLEAESTHWAQDEWRGFYFEFIALPALINAFGGGPMKVANTKFDYCLSEVWDLKVHGDDSHTAILNSQDATDECLRSRGMGLLVLSGTTTTDDGNFRAWQKEFRAANGKSPRARTRPAAFQRRSKSAFTPTQLDAYFVASEDELQIHLGAGLMNVMSQGRQVDGSPRGKKYMLRTDRAKNSSMHLASYDLISR